MTTNLSDASDKASCKNCGSPIKDELYCSNCGQKVYTKRFTLKYFFTVIFDAFSIEKGFFLNLKMLFTDPGRIIHDYLGGRTKDYYNPLKYLLVVAGINALLMIWFDIFETNVTVTNELFGFEQQQLDVQQKVTENMKKYLNLFAILIIPFNSLISNWYYKKHHLFYSEHLILNCFLFAQMAVISMLLYPLYVLIPGSMNYFYLVNFFIIAIYLTIAYRKVFKSGIFRSILGALIVNYIGQLVFFIFVFFVTIIVLLTLKAFGFQLSSFLN